MMIFPPLLNPMFWERPGNIPALTRLLVSYLSKAGQEITAGGKRADIFSPRLLSGKLGQSQPTTVLTTVIIIGCVSKLPVISWQGGESQQEVRGLAYLWTLSSAVRVLSLGGQCHCACDGRAYM
jgi:hypothetical protein